MDGEEDGSAPLVLVGLVGLVGLDEDASTTTELLLRKSFSRRRRVNLRSPITVHRAKSLLCAAASSNTRWLFEDLVLGGGACSCRSAVKTPFLQPGSLPG